MRHGFSGSTSITPNDFDISIGWRIAATVAPSPDSICCCTICAKSMRYTWSAPTTTTMSGFSSWMRLSDWKIASAEPENQCLPRRCCAGTVETYEPRIAGSRQVCETCRSSECDLYCVSTTILLNPELIRFANAKSMSRYCPANGTAGFARSAVSGIRRLPSPPASTIPKTFFCAMTMGSE